MALYYYLIILFNIWFLFVTEAFGKCYFPGELQGVWATQAAPDILDTPIAYTMIKISANEISTWGKCYAKKGNNIVLANRSGASSSPCFRCFRLVIASVNVASMISRGPDKCFASPHEAFEACPTTEIGAVNIVLYKLRSPWGISDIQETQCPFSGIYLFSFEKGDRNSHNHRGSGNMKCEQPTSEISNCPFGFSLSLQYRDCTFEEPRVASWHCLGSWRGLDGQEYLAVLDRYSEEGDGKPKYKCGMYSEDKSTGRVFLSFSLDSTCTNGLASPTNGYERYTLDRVPPSPLPSSVREKTCRFPTSLRGPWHNTHVRKTDITYQDDSSLTTLTMRCVTDYGDSEKYAVYTRTDCGKWFYTCIVMKRRSPNVMEIMFGESESKTFSNDLCSKNQFGNSSKWITQARSHLEVAPSCPIIGMYKGELPDSPGYCAQLYSDCAQTDLMYYLVDECSRSNTVYEQNRFQKNYEERPGISMPPKRFGGVSGGGNSPQLHSVRQRPPYSNVPRPITTGNVDWIPSRSNDAFRNSAFNGSVIPRTSLIVSESRREKRSPQSHHVYTGRNVKTTTVSFAWGADSKSNRNNSSTFRGTVRSSFTTQSSFTQFSNSDSQFSNKRFNSRTRSKIELRINNRNRGSGFDGRRVTQEYEQVPHQHRPINTKDNWYNHPPRDDTSGFSRFLNTKSPRPALRGPNVSNHSFMNNRNPSPVNNGFSNVRSRLTEKPRSDPLGFWPSSAGQRPEVHKPYVPPPYVPINDPSPPVTMIPNRGVRIGLPSPSSSLREISSVTTPTSFLSPSNDDNFTNKKRKFQFEEREYQCIGQWEENGFVYVFTQRKDIHSYECFVGVIDIQGVIYIKEAGSSCQRDVKPDDFGMKTVMKAECIQEDAPKREPKAPNHVNQDTGGNRDSRRGSKPREVKETPQLTRPPRVTLRPRSWKPITAGPPKAVASGTPSTGQREVLAPVLTYFLFLFHLLSKT